MSGPTHAITEQKDVPQFDKDIRNVHLIYDYDAHDSNGKPEEWRYEMWFFSPTRIVYAIHGGPMAGRLNYQTASYQCIRPGELWQRNWLEVNAERMKADRKQNWNNLPPSLRHSQQKNHKTPRIQSDWEYSKEAHGDKHNPEDFKRWRGLAEIGKQTDRIMLNEQTDIREVFKGKGNLEPIEEGWETV